MIRIQNPRLIKEIGMPYHSHTGTKRKFWTRLVCVLGLIASSAIPNTALAEDSGSGTITPEARAVYPTKDQWGRESIRAEVLPVSPMSMDEARRQGRGMRILATFINTVAGLAMIGNAAMVAHPSEEPIPAVWAVGGGVFVGGITLDIAGRSKAKKAMLSVAQRKSRFEKSTLTAADLERRNHR